MATIPLKDITFPGLDNTYTIPEIDNTLSTAGKAADAKKTGDEIDGVKEDLNELNSNFADMQSDGAVPSAEQIISDKYTEDKVPYHFRRTGGNGADREYDQIVGGTVCWNQLVENGNFESASGWNTGTVSNNVLTITHLNDSAMTLTLRRNCTVTTGHKFFFTCDVRCSANNSVRVKYPFLTDATSLTANTWKTYTAIGEVTGAATEVGVQMNSVASATSDYKNYMLFDLTQMFGHTIADYIYQLEQTTAGAGVAFFKSLFPNDYYPYNAGELVSVSGLSEHKTVGFNAWDEEWEVGAYALSDGQKSVDNSRIRNKNFIHVFPNTSYCNGCPQIITALFYDSDKNFIGQYGYNSGQVFVTPARAQYMNFYVAQSYGNVYKNDICINLSDPTKNGQYEPYKAHSYPLDDSLTLRGLFKLDANNKLYADGDTYDADGTVTRKYGIVDLGTLNWNYNGNWNGGGAFYITLSDAKDGVETQIANIICDKYTTVSSNYLYNNPTTVGVSLYGKALNLRNSAYTDATTFKTAMSGVYLVYELATPITETADPYQHLQQCDPSGTEEYVSTGIVPVGHNSFYPENLRAKVEQLPWNFANLIAPTESTFTATRNYTTGSLFIVDNVLYKATSNIANGGSITPNTNCTATTLAEIISALA